LKTIANELNCTSNYNALRRKHFVPQVTHTDTQMQHKFPVIQTQQSTLNGKKILN